MQLFENMGVWAKRLPKSVAESRGGKIIQGRWVDTNKGDIARPDYRARFVGKEFNTGVDATLYAATPPLEALKLLIGHAASHSDGGAHIVLSNVKRAYFHALAKRELYVELPAEDAGHQEGFVGRCLLSCDLLFMVLVMRRHSGKSVCQIISLLAAVLVADRILACSTMSR